MTSDISLHLSYPVWMERGKHSELLALQEWTTHDGSISNVQLNEQHKDGLCVGRGFGATNTKAFIWGAVVRPGVNSNLPTRTRSISAAAFCFLTDFPPNFEFIYFFYSKWGQTEQGLVGNQQRDEEWHSVGKSFINLCHPRPGREQGGEMWAGGERGTSSRHFQELFVVENRICVWVKICSF